MYIQAKSLLILSFIFYVGCMPAKSLEVLPAHTGGIELMWPIDEGKFWLSSYFGPRKKPNGQASFHKGIDMAALKGTRVKAAASGVVEQAYEDKGYGKTIVIVHDNGYKTRYAHLDRMIAAQGQRVTRGQLIGEVGATGNVRTTGKDPSHLHFEVYVGDERVNPLHYLKKEKQ